MTTDQLMGLLRQVLPFLGGVAIALGWLTADQVGKLTTIILQISGPVLALAGIVWSFIANGRASILTAAANTPGVAGIVTTKNEEGVALANSIPVSTVVPAGTPAAAVIAQASTAQTGMSSGFRSA